MELNRYRWIITLHQLSRPTLQEDQPIELCGLPGKGVEASHLVGEVDLGGQPHDVHRKPI